MTRFKVLLLIVSLFLMTLMVSNPVQAEQITKNTVIIIKPLGEDLNGYEYVPKTKSYYKKQGFYHEATNLSSLPDDVTYTVSRTVNTSLNSSVSVTIDGVIAQAGFGFEVSIGVSQTRTWSQRYSIPAWTKTACTAGSLKTRVTGIQNRWTMGRLMETKNITGDWSYGSYSDKWIIKYYR